VNPTLSPASPEVQAILSKYPPEFARSAIMPLLFLAQRENGFVKKEQIAEIAALVHVTPTEVASVVGFYTLFHDEPGGKYYVQVCTDLPCLMRGADVFLEQLCANIGIKVGETTEDGLITIEEVKCLAGCHRAPMFQVQSGEGISYHENQSVKSALTVIEKLKENPRGEEKA
jgi:NADH-quinone oxidoreductase subunit E